MPACSSTRRCLVIAWRVMRVPPVSCAIERGSPALSAAISDSRVSSPSAAHTTAWWRRFAALASLVTRDMSLDVPELRAPAAVVHAECLRAACGRQFLEPGLGDPQQRAAGNRLQPEFHQRRRFAGIILLWIDRVRMPGEAEELLRLHLLDDYLPAQVLVARYGEMPGRGLSGDERG